MNSVKTLFACGLIILPAMLYAAENKHSVTAGVGISDGVYNGAGINLKYRYEFNEKWGAGISYTSIANILPGGVFNSTGGYNAISAGSFYRILPTLSTYVLAGIASTEQEERWLWGEPVDRKDRAPVVSVGFQLNPWQHFILDISWEHSHLLGQNNNTWIIGAGYRF